MESNQNLLKVKITGIFMLKRDKRVMSGKKGQVTIFIVIALLIVGSVGLYYVLKNFKISDKKYPAELEPVNSFVMDCIKEVSEGGVIYVADRGGYLYPPEFSSSKGVPYYYYSGKSYMPTQKQVEDELANYINNELVLCVNNFVDFPDYMIKEGTPAAKVNIDDNEVIVDVIYPLSVKKGNVVFDFKEFNNVRIPTNLGLVYSAVGKVIEEQLTHEGICITCILDIAQQYDLYMDMSDEDDGKTTVFVFRDENSKINDEPLRYSFAGKYP